MFSSGNCDRFQYGGHNGVKIICVAASFNAKNCHAGMPDPPRLRFGGYGFLENFSAYLPRRSASRLTVSPRRRSFNAVAEMVCGMIQRQKLFLPTPATVRLMPSTAMEPFRIT